VPSSALQARVRAGVSNHADAVDEHNGLRLNHAATGSANFDKSPARRRISASATEGVGFCSMKMTLIYNEHRYNYAGHS